MVDRMGNLDRIADARLIVQIARSAAALRVALDAQEIAAAVGRLADQGIAAHEPAIQPQVHVGSRPEGRKGAAVGIAQIEQANGVGLESNRVQAQADALQAHAPLPSPIRHGVRMVYSLAVLAFPHRTRS